MLVACLGDVMLDVLVQTHRNLVPDDDVPAHITFAAGGQAANVATWVCALGGRARLFGPATETGPGSVVRGVLEAHGVEVLPAASGRVGTVLSLVVDGTRSMASDPVAVGWLDEVGFGPWVDGADWLFVSGYALLRSSDPDRIVRTAAAARSSGTRVAVDLASAVLITRFGPAELAELCRRLQPEVVFGTDLEWASWPGGFGSGARVLKHGPRGASFVVGELADVRKPLDGPVVDPTGAGDALAAGYLLGGRDLAMDAAARCVARVGAQPAEPR